MVFFFLGGGRGGDGPFYLPVPCVFFLFFFHRCLPLVGVNLPLLWCPSPIFPLPHVLAFTFVSPFSPFPMQSLMLIVGLGPLFPLVVRMGPTWCSLFQMWCLIFMAWHVLSLIALSSFLGFFLIVFLAIWLPFLPFFHFLSLGLGVKGGPL